MRVGMRRAIILPPVLILLYMCPHTTQTAMCPHTTTGVWGHIYSSVRTGGCVLILRRLLCVRILLHVSSYVCWCLLTYADVLLYMCPHTTQTTMCPHTTTCVLIRMLTYADACWLQELGYGAAGADQGTGICICVCTSLYTRMWLSLYACVGLFICGFC